MSKLIALSGFAQTGKDTVAAYLVDKYGFERRAFADAVREAVYILNPQVDGFTLQELVDGLGWERAKAHKEIRRLLQVMGTDLARRTWDEDFWVNLMFDGRWLGDLVVITDARFVNEADKVVAHGGEVWRVERPGYSPVNGHISETALSDYDFDRVIENSGSLEDLYAKVEAAL